MIIALVTRAVEHQFARIIGRTRDIGQGGRNSRLHLRPPPSLLRAGKRCIRRDIKSNIKYPPSARLISRLILSRTKKKLRSTQEILSFVSTYFIRVVNYIHIAGSFRGYPAIRVQVKEIEPIQLFLPTNISRLSKFLDAIVN